MTTLLVFEHGLAHTKPGSAPYLRLTVETSGVFSLDEVDEHLEPTFRGRAQLTQQELAELEALVHPDKMRMLGKSLGAGPAWARVVFLHNGEEHVTHLLHATSPGVLLPEKLRGVAKAGLPILSRLLELFDLVEGGFVEATRRQHFDESFFRKEQPINVEGPHGSLLLRFHFGSGRGLWIKVWDAGIVEYRSDASEEGDGDPAGEFNAGTGRVAEWYELIRRHVPKVTERPRETAFTWEVYRSGKRDLRVAYGDEGVRTPNLNKAQLAAIADACATFGTMVDTTGSMQPT
jgi:hypothetical protein